MTDKAYIVANEQQEREVLETLEREGLKWKGFSEEPTQWLPTRDIGYIDVTFPYVLFGNDVVSWCRISELQDDYEIVFDGRKEEQMSEKYVVSQEFMKGLEDWKEILRLDNVLFIGRKALSNLPNLLDKWWRDGRVSVHESNNRLIAIIRWVNGEDVFEVEKPKKWVVRSKETDSTYCYAQLLSENNNTVFMGYSFANATRFDTKEEAESWANAHQEVIEVVD
ncbi:hypothetical protein EFL35_03135 [Weissella paramesenteroides]|uniref:hypothetical protein n=1 Tax=Weissella paramesenteroides TaxID=1249 RepID=UPI00223C11C5|nr:hypothetical protein [Weissella paramesenteroides]MCS9983984.1 hypothetical protein [Weissella paramesenteroides]MCS9998996.1 hypothetical protein [Weissella paramesenteroides]MCT0259801.1 hypothetical protein [Weissella paramesenteroides]